MSMDDSKQNPKAKETPAQVNLNADAAEMAKLGLKEAQAALSKLPILGPVTWLYARAPEKKFLFLADTDWLVLPPIVLDQCRLYLKNQIPYAFFTWAFVSDAIDRRLREGHPRLAPHEWKSGEHLWLIDLVAPFGGLDEMIGELRKTLAPERKLCGLVPDAKTGTLTVREWPPLEPHPLSGGIH